MGNMHPVFEQALKPFIATPVIPYPYKNPPCPVGEFEYEWAAGIAEYVVCHLEYEAGEQGKRDSYGLPETPDYPSRCYLLAAYIRGLDIVELLSDDQRQEIEEKALDQIERQ